MKKKIFALLLALCLLISSASALNVEQAKAILTKYYIDEVPEDVLSRPAIEEMLDALGDPYTAYYSAEEYQAFLDSMEDTKLVGIGIRSYYREEGVLLLEVASDSPASEAGLRAGDCLIAVDGHDVRGAEPEDIDGWIRGEEGTCVEVTVLRDGETFQASMRRRAVVFPTVTLDKIENQVGWITCSAFGSTTFQYFYDIITAHDEEVAGWVVDLRGNGGGDVLAAVFSAGCFAGSQQGVYLRDRSGEYTAYLNDPNLIERLGYYDGEVTGFDSHGYLTYDPVYVLTDEDTASASELFCAAIRDSGAGLIIGTRTFGKGVAQTLFSAESHRPEMAGYFDEGDAMKVTTDRAYSTAGATYDHVGVMPHLLLEDGEDADEVAALLAAPVSDGEDALYLSDLSSVSSLVGSLVLPWDQLTDPANAETAALLLSALPPSVSCRLCLDGEKISVNIDGVAEICGAALEARTFSDLQGGTDFEQKINTLAVYGLVSGPGDGAYHAGETLSRSALCALLAKMLRLPQSGQDTGLSDVPDWCADYVDALCAIGLIQGDENGLFRPDDPVTREEFYTVLGRAAQWLDMDFYERSQHDGIYGDVMPSARALASRYESYASWAREMVWLCDSAALYPGLSAMDPAEAVTREEAAVALYELLRVSGVLSV